MFVVDSKSLQYNRVLQERRYSVSYGDILLGNKIKINVGLNQTWVCCVAPFNYHGAKARSEVVRSDKDMVGAIGAIPKGVMRGNEGDGGGNEGTSMAYGREAIDGAEIARNINRYEEKISCKWVKCPVSAVHKGSMNGHLRSKQMVRTPLVCSPIHPQP